jgi:hypothetical protein
MANASTAGRSENTWDPRIPTWKILAGNCFRSGKKNNWRRTNRAIPHKNHFGFTISCIFVPI